MWSHDMGGTLSARKRRNIIFEIINMAADGELMIKQRLGEHSQIIAFANEIIDIVISSDLQQEVMRSADTVEKVKCKVSRSKESVLESIQGNYLYIPAKRGNWRE